MKILQPAQNKVVEKVKNLRSIKKEAEEFLDYVVNGKFEGLHTGAYAISHAQVSENPKNYFVLNPALNSGELIKTYGHWCIVNLRITKKEDPVSFKEGCMSFPYRKIRTTHRFNKITVEYQIPFAGLFLIPKRKKLEGLYAFIAQHEVDHATGKNIYNLQ